MESRSERCDHQRVARTSDVGRTDRLIDGVHAAVRGRPWYVAVGASVVLVAIGAAAQTIGLGGLSTGSLVADVAIAFVFSVAALRWLLRPLPDG